MNLVLAVAISRALILDESTNYLDCGGISCGRLRSDLLRTAGGRGRGELESGKEERGRLDAYRRVHPGEW
eukprot:1659869-Heterocapsa_arctica.AAC.1